MNGICLDKITSEFPIYPLNEVESEIHQVYASKGKSPEKLPKLPHSVGGNTDLMIGIQYLKYYPKIIFSLPNGLTIYESQFLSSNGTRGVIGGPHRIFTEIHNNLKGTHLSMSAYMTDVVNAYRYGFQLSLDVPLLGNEEFEPNMDCLPDDRCRNAEAYASKPPQKVKLFEQVELAGTEVSYRCVRCRGCQDCKKSADIENISIQEEVEQSIIDKSVTVDLQNGFTSAKLPFLVDPTKKLAPNRHIARKIYFGQIRKLNMSTMDKIEIIASENKLQELGFVDFVDNLTVEQQSIISRNPVSHFIPWRAVWNTNSVSTPCRLVFDASQVTSTGLSLNNLLAKGRNNMNKLVEIAIRWQIRKSAFHTDIRKMYNTIRLAEEHWCYQLYLWQDNLNQDEEPRHKVIKTLIYGVKSSGNQAERGIRETGNLLKNEYPRQNEIINSDIYVDDCLSGEDTNELTRETTDGLKLVLNKGGFDLKGFTFSGFNPPEHLANKDKSINVAGMKWFPKEDSLSLNINELNFGKKCRGKKAQNLEGIIPENFTRRDCAGKVAEIFDLLGKITPISAALKLDLSELCQRNLDWDDYIPSDLKTLWQNNFELIRKLGEIKFRRARVPEDAVSLEMETIEMADASPNLMCSAIYGRFKRKTGSYSCQLLFARSKIVPKNTTMPRAELSAALLNATTGHVTYVALRNYIKSRVHLTDSQIVLFWLNNTKSHVKQWVRNRVVEINRLTNKENWFYIESQNMTADLGTRKGVKIEDISENSSWLNGPEWAKKEEQFPIKSSHEIKLSKEDVKKHNDEMLKADILDIEWINKQLSAKYGSYPVLSEKVLSEIAVRYKFSQYIIDPNRFRFRKVVRILALVLLFIKNLKLRTNRNSYVIASGMRLPSQFMFCNDKYLITQNGNAFPFNCQQGLVVILTEALLMAAINYFYKKATLEIKQYNNKKAYKNISIEKDEILYYTGRILPSQEFNGNLNLADVCLDLTTSTFCVPLIDKSSPLAYALVNEVHWYDDDAKHSGNETVLRHVQNIAHIIEGRPLVKKFRKECARCRLLLKKAIDVAMGPISETNLCIAPAFYYSQVDIFGPFNSYSNINKRATVKIWFVIFCCCATSAVDIRVMEDYSTNSFILSFVRFSCKYGYPKKLLPDAGSQLVKGCQIMTLSFCDIRHKLHKEHGIEFETCPVGAHYVHGKVERKIKHAQESFSKCNNNHRLSIIQWETLGDQVANSINNLPLAIGNLVEGLENLDILTPNRLILARNNNRCPMGTLEVTDDPQKIVQRNNEIRDTWFKCWLVSYVPLLMSQPKWFKSDRDTKTGDVVLFLKSDKQFDKQYQYGIVANVKVSRDGKIREIEIEYLNHNENTKRRTIRGVRDVVVIHPVDELGIMQELSALNND